MATTILEVSSSNADIVTNNSLTTIFNPPIDIPTPSVLNFQQGFLDLRALGNSGTDSFVLDEVQQITMDVAYYECYLEQVALGDVNVYNVRNQLVNGKKVDTGDDDDDELYSLGKMHMLYVVNYEPGHEPESVNGTPIINKDTLIDSFELVKETFTAFVPAGIYTADSLVKYMNDQFQGKAFSVEEQYGAFFFDYGLTGNVLYTPWQSLVEKYTVVVPNSDPVRYKSALVFIKLDQETISFDYKAERPDGKPINIGYSYPQKQPTIKGSADRTGADIMIGCPIVSLENNDGIISFSYLHNPPYQIDKESGDRNQFVQVQSNFAEKTRIYNYYIFARGGLNLIGLQPPTFWGDLLGFDISQKELKVIVEPAIELTNGPSEFILAKDNNSFNSSTTRPFYGTSTLDNYISYDTLKEEILTTEYNIQQQNTREKPDGFRALDVVDTESIDAISPIQFAQFNTGGHFLITIDIGYYVNNFNGAKLKKNITCVASREYLTNGFLSILSGGTPIILQAGSVISYIQLTIIDPITKQPATDIGTNNSFYLTLSS
jgi:hypothetical protein